MKRGVSEKEMESQNVEVSVEREDTWIRRGSFFLPSAIFWRALSGRSYVFNWFIFVAVSFHCLMLSTRDQMQPLLAHTPVESLLEGAGLQKRFQLQLRKAVHIA